MALINSKQLEYPLTGSFIDDGSGFTAISASSIVGLEIPNTGSFAITGSNTFIGDQNISGSINFGNNTRIILDDGGSLGSIDLKAGSPTGWAELQSHDSNQYIWVDNSNAYIGTDWNTNSFVWVFDRSGSLRLPINSTDSIINQDGSPFTSSIALNAELLDGQDRSTFATTGSNIFKGDQIISGTLDVTSVSTFGNHVHVTGDENSPFPYKGYISISGSEGARIDFYKTFGSTTLTTVNNDFLITSPSGSGRLLFPDGNISLISSRSIFLFSNSVTASNDMAINGGLQIGTTDFTPLSREKLIIDGGSTDSFNLITARSDTNNYSQFNIQNINNGVSASSDVVATNDIGNETTYFVDMGINGSNYINNGNGIGTANDAYLYTTGSNLLVGNTTPDRDLILFSQRNIIGSGSFDINGDISTFLNKLFIIKDFDTQQPVLTVTQSIVQFATQSFDPSGNTNAGSIWFTSSSLYIGLE